MNTITRRNLLKALLGGALQAAATVVVARAVPVTNAAESTGAVGDVQARADRIAEGVPASPDGLEPVAFVNGGFRNGGGGGFRKGGFANGGGGGFKNGGFANGGGGGGFKNGGFANGGGGGFKNGSFRNY